MYVLCHRNHFKFKSSNTLTINCAYATTAEGLERFNTQRQRRNKKMAKIDI